ncbi:MAG: VWA domain-containing protein [Planctomycetes bacterium]|nr:VWA domain-containing protein [Planctomycetota bacterium]
MGLTQPWQLIWLVLAAMVLLLYFVGRRRAINVSSHLLWQRTLANQGAWRRWQRVLSAALVALLLVALAVVLAEPYWQSDRNAARTIVLVLGNGGAVAKDANVASKESALQHVDNLRLYERMAILAADGPPHVLCPLTDDRVKLREAIETVALKESPGSIAAATDLAKWMLADQQNPKIIVWPEQSSAGDSLFTAASGKSVDPPGTWLLVAALALCGGEWLLFSRRFTV